MQIQHTDSIEWQREKKSGKIAYTCDSVFDATALMCHELFIFADEILHFFNWQRKFRQSEKSCQIGRIERCQNRNENPPR